VTVGGALTTAVLEPGAGERSGTVLMLAHGAGSHMNHPAILASAAALRARGIDVARFDFLYRARGAGRPDPMPALVACTRAVAETVRAQVTPHRLLLGGRSLGGRAASVLAAEGYACDGLVLLAYPLHPPGKPQQMRNAHLARITVPVLLVNGTRDDFCRRDLMERVLAALPQRFTMHWLDGADHAFHVLRRSGRSDAEVLDEAADAVARWLRAMVAA
jgi:hypothetical protein